MAIKEQSIIAAIVDRLKTITTGNGYLTDAGTTVADSKTHWQEEDLPAISVFQGPVTSEGQDDEGYIVIRTMPVLIKTFLKSVDDSDNDAEFVRKVIRDIYAAIRTDPFWTVGGHPLTNGTSEKAHSFEYTDSYEITGILVELEIEYASQSFQME